MSEIWSQTHDDFSGHSLTMSVDSYRYLLTIDIGNWTKTSVDSATEFADSGHFYRLGVDANFLLNDPGRNVFFFGLRYGHSSFSQDLTRALSNAVWGDTVLVQSTPNVKAHWLELASGIKVRVWDWVWLGYTASYKFRLKTPEDLAILPYDVPGFGRTFKPTVWGFNYYIFLRLPVRKNPGAIRPTPR